MAGNDQPATSTPQTEFLGKISNEPTDRLDPIPWKGGEIKVRLDCSEWTSRCPVTQQPDFAVLEIEYRPKDFIVETKSAKLFLWSYRERAAFNEALISELASIFFEQIKPHWVRVTGHFHPRGGIAVTAEAERSQNV